MANFFASLIKKSIPEELFTSDANKQAHFLIEQSFKNFGIEQVPEIILIGIRDNNMEKPDEIKDLLGFWTPQELQLFKGTTSPGVPATKDKSYRNKQGTFHLDEGYHKKIWCFGTHKGYEALVNDGNYCLPTKGWRDANYDFKYDASDLKVKGYFGINFHRMHPTIIASIIGKYSAGCQVIQDAKNFEYIKKTLKNTEMFKSNKKVAFDYILFKKEDFPFLFV